MALGGFLTLRIRDIIGEEQQTCSADTSRAQKVRHRDGPHALQRLQHTVAFSGQFHRRGGAGRFRLTSVTGEETLPSRCCRENKGMECWGLPLATSCCGDAASAAVNLVCGHRDDDWLGQVEQLILPTPERALDSVSSLTL